METKIAMILIIVAFVLVMLILAFIKLLIDMICEKEIKKRYDKLIKYIKLQERTDDLDEKDSDERD